METAVKTLVFLFALLSLGLWITEIHPHLASAGMPALSLVPLEPGVIAAQQPALPAFQETGVLMYDLAHGTPGTPYLVYFDAHHAISVKQLIFSGSGCDVSAADAPCSAGPYENPDIPGGTPLTVTGGLQGQGVFVGSYQNAGLPENMLVFSVHENQVATLSNSTSIALTGVAADASCTLGVGCFGDGTARAEVQITSDGVTTNTQLIPGALHQAYKTTFVVLSIDGTNPDAQATILAIRTRQ